MGDFGDCRPETPGARTVPRGAGGIGPGPGGFDFVPEPVRASSAAESIQHAAHRPRPPEEDPNPGLAADRRPTRRLPGHHAAEIQLAVGQLAPAQALDQLQTRIERVAPLRKRGAFRGSDLPRPPGPAGDPEIHVQDTPARALEHAESRAVLRRMDIDAFGRRHPGEDRQGAPGAAALPVNADEPGRRFPGPGEERGGHRGGGEPPLVVRRSQPVNAGSSHGGLAGGRGPAVRSGLGVHVGEEGETRGFRRAGDQVHRRLGCRWRRAELRVFAQRLPRIPGDLDREAVAFQVLPEPLLRLPRGASVGTRRLDQVLEEREQFGAGTLGQLQRVTVLHGEPTALRSPRGNR